MSLCETHKTNISKALRGKKRKHCSKETKEKISLSKRGKKQTKEHIEKRINARKTNDTLKQTDLTKEKIRKSKTGQKFTLEHKLNISKGTSGKNNWNWKGGVSSLRLKIWKTDKYKEWRLKIFKKNNYLCQICFSNKRLEAHHIKTFAEIINEYKISTVEEASKCIELWLLENGITYCKKCHLKLHGKLRTLEKMLE